MTNVFAGYTFMANRSGNLLIEKQKFNEGTTEETPPIARWYSGPSEPAVAAISCKLYDSAFERGCTEETNSAFANDRTAASVRGTYSYVSCLRSRSTDTEHVGNYGYCFRERTETKIHLSVVYGNPKNRAHA
ncbi:hypothetical protein K0M31_000250 [Melipona bicolor]|uniref:Uncharacterized protein n=1 Tax=Melipona bicolor TaxID=60889 RepID=A0AA40KWM8_9HYME|nr:hypothetical protein K0M31_000250 [Melipona bicolor]